MKKFEEEIFGKVETMITQPGCSMTRKVWYKADDIHELSKDWVSPEDHQAEVRKIELQNLKYREEIARMQKSLRKKNKAIKELNGAVKKNKARLKECEDLRIEANNKAAMEYSRKCEVVEDRAELKRENQRLRAENLAVKTLVEDAKKQQPEIPEVPQFVADWLEYCKEMQVSLYFAVTYFSKVASGKITEGSSSYDDYGYGVSEENSKLVRHWFTSDVHNQEKLALAYINGYTVKEKRFYLKNKLTGQRLIRLLEENGGGFLECVTSTDKERMQFTQREIDSMETGSYEQIEVAE